MNTKCVFLLFLYFWLFAMAFFLYCSKCSNIFLKIFKHFFLIFKHFFFNSQRSLDRELTVEECIELCQIAHGDFFSMTEWNKFHKKFPIKNALLSWNELRVFLCTIPATKPLHDPEPEIKKVKLNFQSSEIEIARQRGEKQS